MRGPFDPRQLEELLGAYALDALDEEEAAAVERYLATDPRARAEDFQKRVNGHYVTRGTQNAPWDQVA